MSTENFDERQLKIQGDIFKHMFFILMCLIIFNTFLLGFGVVWAPAWSSGFIVLLVAVAAGSIEMIFREVYIGNRNARWVPIIPIALGILSGGLMLKIALFLLSSGEAFAAAGQLTNNGSGFVMMLLIFSIFVGYIVKLLFSRKAKQEE